MLSPDLVPRTKTDVEAARRAVDAGYPATAPVLGELLEWLQDFNWPVAKVLVPFLREIGPPLIPHIDRAFSSNDWTWKYWIIECLISGNRDLFQHYLPELTRIAHSPTLSERQHEIDQVARDALLKYGQPPD